MKSFFSTITGFTSLILFTSTQAAPLSNGESCAAIQKTDESTYFSVVGVQGTGVHPRQELRELEKDAETWNLFLQAFARFQAMDQSDKVSYFQVAAIHGAPFREWDGVKGNGSVGYCPHVSNVFLTWHRPYLALFEQVLQRKAVEIANEYPVGDAQDNALFVADRIRLPYWDWALDPRNSSEGVMPTSLSRQTTIVTFPNGTLGEIPNPLYQYSFHPLKYDDFSALAEYEFKYWNTTIRLPEDGTSIEATSRNDVANERATTAQPNNRDTLYKLLTTYQPFNQWSTTADGGNIGNVESLHNSFHNMFGLGNMGIVEASAFDPVFWLHHCQMDRIMAIYQYRYPDTWVEPASQPKGTYTFAANSVQNASSPLEPFHMNANGDLWTSALVRNWTSFGYTYPELISNPSNTTLTNTINKLYKPQIQGLDSNSTDNYSGATNSSVKATDWNAAVTMPADIQVSYSVRAFLGEPNADPTKWAIDPNYIGQVASTSSPRMRSNITFTANICLTSKLFEKFQAGELPSLKDEDVSAYLEKHFHWRIQALDYSEIPRSSPPKGLNVTVFNVPIHIPKNDTDVPKWTGSFDYKPEIHGNPPNTTGSGPSLAGAAGGWNATSGSWHWNNTDSAVGAGVAQPSLSSSVSLRVVESKTLGSAASSVTPGPGEAVEVVTMPDGQRVTKIVTVVVPVTVYVPAPTE
ncbi:hypothetical protein N0V90_007630 [Kalmusia sp. IMI 367209]|nr:hypothetical protein N0V90_007630 [Kalmusia sp. IMI 367209]